MQHWFIKDFKRVSPSESGAAPTAPTAESGIESPATREFLTTIFFAINFAIYTSNGQKSDNYFLCHPYKSHIIPYCLPWGIP